MVRSGGLSAVIAGLIAAFPAQATEITRVSSSGEIDRIFDLSLSVRWERSDRRATIAREFAQNQGAATGSVEFEPELSFREVTNRIVPGLQMGLWRDLELRAELPYQLPAETSWRYVSEGGVPIDQIAGRSAIAGNTIDASGAPCTGSCPMLSTGKTLYGGGALDDLRVGLAWAALNEKREPWSVNWVISLDVTTPTASRFDPAGGRAVAGGYGDSPHFTRGDRAAVGRKIWIYDIGTAVSRRLGAADPYFRAYARLPQLTHQTYSNCEHAADLVAAGEMWSGAGGAITAATQCASAAWKKEAEARPPSVYGVALGAEFIPYEHRGSGQKFTVELRAGGEYVTAARWYNELTPATGRLLASEAYLAGSGLLGMSLRASRYVLLGVQGTFQYQASHFITGEAQGRISNEIVAPNGADQNPNFDWRWDLPGRRFRLQDSFGYTVAASALLTF